MNGIIEFKHVYKYYENRDTPAVVDANLVFEEGEFNTILGTSGSGKTTLLKMVNGLIPISEGDILYQGKSIKTLDMTEYRRGIGYVIQHAGLFPHKTVFENVATVPQMLGWDKKRIADRVDELLDLMQLPPERYAQAFPRMLSGGEQQRVGIARALATDPPVMLMDEPFGAIDAITREHLQNELCRIQEKLKKTILFVTHDIQEAFKMGDKILVMHEGAVQQFDTPYNIVFNPKTDYVRTLLSTGNFFDTMKAIPAKALMSTIITCQDDVPHVLETDSLAQVLEIILLKDAQLIRVVDQSGATIGQIASDIFSQSDLFVQYRDSFE